MSDFGYLRGRTGFFYIELVASCLTFPTPYISLKSEFYNSRYSLKYEERSDNNSLKMDSNSWTVTVQAFVNERF
jgi:hypothetical protein